MDFLRLKAFVFLCFLSCGVLCADLMIDQRDWDRSQCKPKLELSAKSFAKKMEQKLPKWAEAQICEDFAFFKEGIDQSLSDKIFSEGLMAAFKLLRIKISNNTVCYSIDRAHIGDSFYKIMHAIEALTGVTKIPDVDFYISLQEGLSVESPIPIFVFSKNQELKTLALIPDPQSLNGFKEMRKEMEKRNKKSSWDDKKSKVFWRGCASGGIYLPENWFFYPRSALCLLSLNIPGVLDAKFSDYSHLDPVVLAKFQELRLLGEGVAIKKEIDYRYLMDVDGNLSELGRLVTLLHTNCLVFKQASKNYQWFYKALIPGKHFVEVKEDFSNLLELYFWAEENYVKTKKIVKKANECALELFTDENVYQYLVHVLHRYADLCKKKETGRF